MAGKKGNIANSDFLNRVAKNTRGAAKSVSETLDKVEPGKLQKEGGKKRIEYIDISKMEG